MKLHFTFVGDSEAQIIESTLRHRSDRAVALKCIFSAPDLSRVNLDYWQPENKSWVLREVGEGKEAYSRLVEVQERFPATGLSALLEADWNPLTADFIAAQWASMEQEVLDRVRAFVLARARTGMSTAPMAPLTFPDLDSELEVPGA